MSAASIRQQNQGGGMIFLGAVLALILYNTPFRDAYQALLLTPTAIFIGDIELHKPLALWINDGLMTLFFLVVGLEIKEEILEGSLSRPKHLALPGIAALGGVVVPALCYLAITGGGPVSFRGWAIPTATDIVFSMTVLMMLGYRAPPSLMVFLLTLAVVDDIAAIGIIAVVYSESLHWTPLAAAGCVLVGLGVMNHYRVHSMIAWMVVGAILWAAILKSGLHPTLAGVMAAAFVPMHIDHKERRSPLRLIVQELQPWLNWAVLPLFAFVNAGVYLGGVAESASGGAVGMGIIAGLVIGKPLGVLAFSWAAIRMGWASLPLRSDWLQFLGVGFLCGIGFTMSLFIGELAFHVEMDGLNAMARVGVLAGSALAALAGFGVLWWAHVRKRTHRHARRLQHRKGGGPLFPSGGAPAHSAS